MTRRKFNDVDRVVNPETGEQLTTRKEITISGNPDEFFMVFLQNLSALYQLKNATEIHVLAKLCSLATLNTNTTLLPPALRKQICEEMNISQQAMTNALRELKRKGLLEGDNGVFTINPELMWKGSTDARRKWMESKHGLELTILFRSNKNSEQNKSI